MAEKKQSVRAKINGLNVGESVAFPLTRYDYVLSCRYRLQLGSDKVFTSHQDKENNEVIITREEDKTAHEGQK